MRLDARDGLAVPRACRKLDIPHGFQYLMETYYLMPDERERLINELVNFFSEIPSNLLEAGPRKPFW